MGISRDSRHKRRSTGGRRNVHQKKRKYELGRPAANTKLGAKKVVPVRGRGATMKYRALRIDSGNFSWGSEATTRKARILDVVYNASNMEMVRTKMLVKNCIVQIDATNFRQWYEQQYGEHLGKTKKGEEKKVVAAGSKKVQKVRVARNRDHVLEDKLRDQFNSGRLYACISSRPGQSGRCDGYVLEAKELEFYMRKLSKKK
jgi:small subunit ribosomal protein S8e